MAVCDKRAWASEHAAKRKLKDIRRKRDRSRKASRVEVRVYRCTLCLRWHVTSHLADYTLPSQRHPLRVIEARE